MWIRASDPPGRAYDKARVTTTWTGISWSSAGGAVLEMWEREAAKEWAKNQLAAPSPLLSDDFGVPWGGR